MDPVFHWVSQPSILPEPSQHESQRQTSSSLDDWSKERPSTMSQTGSIGVGSSSATNNMDINDFTTLGELGGEHMPKYLQHHAFTRMLADREP